MRRALIVLTFALVLIVGPVSATAVNGPPERQIPDGAELGLDGGLGMSHPDQHGSTSGHLPPSSENVELVGKLRLTSHEGDISDVSALQTADGRWFAYVGDWGAHCPTGGVHVVDITDPANPTKAGFLNSGGFGYVTEGLQALHVDTAAFTGDILVVSNEWCQVSGNPRNMPGGITIWDITEPSEPKQLVRAFGDFDLFGNRANEAHSVIAWDAGDNVYAAAIDNNEAFDDVDIFDITDPRNPVLVSETGLFDLNVSPPVARWPAEFDAFGQEPTSHDFDIIQKPDGTWHLMVSYWDAGWVDLDVTDPANPTFVEDSTYAECDQVVQEATGECLQPEGNAHQGEWNADASLFIGTDEDFTPTRANCSIDAAVIGCTEFGWTDLVPLTERDPANFTGTPVFGGSGCVEDVNPANGTSDRTDVLNNLTKAQTGADAIAFVRGTCFFSDKVQTGIEAGYDMVIVINSHGESANGLIPNAFFAGGQGSPITPGVASAVMIGHANGHELFNDRWSSAATISRSARSATPSPPRAASWTAGATFACWTATRPAGSPRSTSSPSPRRSIQPSTRASVTSPSTRSKCRAAIRTKAAPPRTTGCWPTSPGTQEGSAWPPTTPPASRRSVTSSTRAATISGASRSPRTRTETGSSSPATETSVCTSRSLSGCRSR